MNADLQGKRYLPRAGYAVSTGVFFDGRDAYRVDVIGNGSDSLEVDLRNEDREIEVRVSGQVGLNGAGIDESLSVSTGEPGLPETDEELEAYARYALEHGEDFDYDGPLAGDLLEEGLR